MKKMSINLLIIAILASVFAGCKKTEATSKTSVSKWNKEYGNFIKSGWVVYEEQKDGKMYAIKQASYGDDVLLVYSDPDNKILDRKTATRRVVSTGEEDELEFIHIILDNDLGEETDYWTRAAFVAPPKCMKVVMATKDIFTYSKPDGMSFSKTSLKKGELIVSNFFFEDENRELEEAKDYYEAFVYNGEDFGKTIYVKKTDCTDSGITIELYRTIMALNKDTKTVVADELAGRILQALPLSQDSELLIDTLKASDAPFSDSVKERISNYTRGGDGYASNAADGRGGDYGYEEDYDYGYADGYGGVEEGDASNDFSDEDDGTGYVKSGYPFAEEGEY